MRVSHYYKAGYNGAEMERKAEMDLDRVGEEGIKVHLHEHKYGEECNEACIVRVRTIAQ